MHAPRSTQRILVAVKSYPRPSRTLQETVCVAGLTADRQWVRWYPVRFRDLPEEQRFRKFDWVEANVVRSSRDYRDETYVPDETSIRIVGHMKEWSERRSFLLPLLDSSVESVKESGRSLGIIKPRELYDFEIEPDDADWTEEQKRALLQPRLFGARNKKILEKIPYKFYYRFRCHDEGCLGHRMQLIDWEVFEAYRSWRYRAGSEAELKKQIRDKFMDDFMAKRDVYFYIGTALQQHRFGIFLVIGVFYPPPMADQLRLFD